MVQGPFRASIVFPQPPPGGSLRHCFSRPDSRTVGRNLVGSPCFATGRSRLANRACPVNVPGGTHPAHPGRALSPYRAAKPPFTAFKFETCRLALLILYWSTKSTVGLGALNGRVHAGQARGHCLLSERNSSCCFAPVSLFLMLALVLLMPPSKEWQAAAAVPIAGQIRMFLALRLE